MAANKERGLARKYDEEGNLIQGPVNVQGEPSWFDMGTADMINGCSSCHIGGGPFEGQVQANGSVIPWDSPLLSNPGSDSFVSEEDRYYNRDFASYGPDATTNAFYGADTIEAAINLELHPSAANSDWNKTGVMEADCLMCHIDPEGSNTLMAADGLKADPNRPRMMIFAERDANGLVNKVSLGTPFANGLANQVARPYTDGLNRMSRPSGYQTDVNGEYLLDPMGRRMPLSALSALPAGNIGEMMAVWTQGLADIDATNTANGTPLLPFALYGQNVTKIWDAETGMLKAEYCANPNGVMDEMQRMGANQTAIEALFGGFLDYLQGNGFLPATGDTATDMQMMMNMFFNDFIYAYQIKNTMDPSANSMMPIPVSLRAYDKGRFYTDSDDFQASVRDYVRQPLVEGQGTPYNGRPGLGYDAMLYGMGLAMGFPGTPFETTPNPHYMNTSGNGMVDTHRVVFDWQQDTLVGLPEGATKEMFIKGALHDNLPSFYNVMPTAELMGTDMNGNGTPLTYVQLVKDDTSGEWIAKTYYEVGEITKHYYRIHKVMFGGTQNADDPRWTRVCGQCHIMVSDHDNSEVELVRKYNLGMSADYVKNGHYVNMTDDPEAEGYDVHLSQGKLGCGSCHLQSKNYRGRNVRLDDYEAMHNFLKGTDTAHNVRNDLDNNLRPKNCEGCHIEQIAGPADVTAADPTAAHEAKFGTRTAFHMQTIACQTCHIPYKKTWRFRAFDDSLGYYGNFDNRMGYNVLNYANQDGSGNVPGPGTMNLMAYPAEYAISPVYGASPGYGIPHFNMVSNQLEANSNGQVSMDYVSEMVDYFHLRKSGDPGQLVNGMPTNPQFDFWKYFYQMFFNQKAGMLGWDTDMTGANGMMDPNAPDHKVYPPLYYGNGTNGYPQIVIGNPITIMTWVDANAGEGEMNGISYNGAKILYLRELMAAMSEYHMPTTLGTIPPMDMYMIPANDPTYRENPGVGKVILKPTPTYPEGYVLFDHTGDMYPEIWHEEDVRAVQEALKIVLAAEGKPNALPAIFMAAHYFSDTHGVKPASKALGADSCTDCHASKSGSPGGAHRIADRLINFLPWTPPWFQEENRLLKYDAHENAMLPANMESGFFIVDGEVDYIKPVGGNGLAFLGARADDILDLSHHHAKHLFYQARGEETLGSAIYGIPDKWMTPEENERLYVPQVTRFIRASKHLSTDWIPVDLRSHVSAFGYSPVEQKIRIQTDGATYTADADVLIYGLNEAHLHDPEDRYMGVMAYLQPTDNATIEAKGFNAMVVFQPADIGSEQNAFSGFNRPWIVINDEDLPLGERRANVVRYGNANDNKWILRAGPGRYAVVNPADMTPVGAPAEQPGPTDQPGPASSAPADQPAPAPADTPAPAPAPADTPAPAPAPADTPAPAPAPADTPAPAPAPADTPAPGLVFAADTTHGVNYADNVAYCNSLVTAATNGRTNWRIATEDEVIANPPTAAGDYWSSTEDDFIDLQDGRRVVTVPSLTSIKVMEASTIPYAICISE